MKKLLIGLLAVGSITSFACPELAGTYSCRSEGSAYELQVVKINDIPTFETSIIEDGINYKVQIIADGQQRTSTEEEDGVVYISKTKFECINDTLKMSFTENTSDNSYTASGTTSSTLDSDGNLISKYDSTHEWNDGSSENDNYTEVCQRVN